MNQVKTIGQKIKACRKKKDITQDALAKIESDVIQNPSLQTIPKIAKGLGISLNDLVK